MGNRTFYAKSRNGKVQESAEYTYNSANQPIKVKEYDGKHYKTVEYSYDADGNRILEEEVKPDDTRKVEKSYEYTVENRLKAVSDKNDLLAAMAYDGDGNRIFQLNYNLHTDDDWKGNSGNGNGNNKDNPGSGNNGNSSGNGTGSKTKAASEETAATAEETTETEPGFWENIVSFFTGDKEEKKETATSSDAFARKNDKPNGNNGNGNGNKPDKPNKPNDNTSTGGTNDNNGNANGNTNNTGGSQNQSGILFPIDGEVSELEGELIGMIKTTGKQKNYELVEYVNDVNREHTEVLMELNINGIMDTAYSYGDQRLTNERFTEWTGYYTYDPRGSVTGVTDDQGMIWQSYRYDAFGSLTFGQPQYNNVYSYNGESYNPNIDAQYLRARYYSPTTADFISEDSYLGDITDPLSLNRYNYTKSSPLNYIDPSGHMGVTDLNNIMKQYAAGMYSDHDLSKKVISKNGDGLLTVFHEIVQIHVGAKFITNGGIVELEKKIQTTAYLTNKNVQRCYEADIALTMAPLSGTMLWEVKPVSTLYKNWLNNKAKNKYETMVEYSNDPVLSGDNSMIMSKRDIPIIGKIYMKYFTDPFNPGFIYYSLYMKKRDEKGEEAEVAVSIPEAIKDIKKRQEVSKEILEFVGGVAVGAIASKAISMLKKLGASQNVIENIDFNNVDEVIDTVMQFLDEVA